MTNKVANNLLGLKNAIESVTRTGDFLLSVNRFSHYWVFIDDLWKKHRESYDLIESTLRILFSNLLAEYGSFTVFSAGSHNRTSEEEVPLYMISDDAVSGLRNSSLKMLREILDQSKPREFQRAIFPGKYVGVFAFSLHIDLIEEMVNNLRSCGSDVVAVVALIEREKVSRQRLAELGVLLIPMIIVDEITGKPQTILEMLEWPYKDTHKYFQDPVKK